MDSFFKLSHSIELNTANFSQLIQQHSRLYTKYLNTVQTISSSHHAEVLRSMF